MVLTPANHFVVEGIVTGTIDTVGFDGGEPLVSLQFDDVDVQDPQFASVITSGLQVTAVTKIVETWLNNILTYRDQTLRGFAAVKGLVLYALICAFGYFSNISVAFLIFYDPSMWWLAGLAGAVISAVWNYAVSAAVIWRR